MRYLSTPRSFYRGWNRHRFKMEHSEGTHAMPDAPPTTPATRRAFKATVRANAQSDAGEEGETEAVTQSDKNQRANHTKARQAVKQKQETHKQIKGLRSR